MKKQLTPPFLILIIAAAMLSSCNSYKRLTYLQDIATTNDTTFEKNKDAYHLQAADILYVRLVTGEEEIDKLFNPLFMQGSGNMSQMRAENLYIMGFEVSDSGYIELPVLDKIQVAGLTVEEARAKIKDLAYDYLKNPQVIVKMHTFQFSILGEVSNPGMIEYGAYELNLMEALALGGDITYNGNRENILILRPQGDKYKAFRVDITNQNIVGTEQFFIQPNDIIYVEPLRTTLFRETTQDYMFFVSAVSSVLSLTVLILSLL